MIDRIILTIFAILIILFVNIVIGSRIDNIFERMNHEDENEQGIEGSQKEAKKMMNCNCNASIVILNRSIDDHGHGDYTCWCPCCGLQVHISR